MKEKIRQFAKESGLDIYGLGKDRAKWEDTMIKFAELIVRECARIARATPCPYEEDEVRQRLGHTWDMASLEAGHEIVKHFGVEE